MKRRKVLFKDTEKNVYQIVITDAPKEVIEKWCLRFIIGEWVELFDTLKCLWYVKELYDSTYDEEAEDMEIIGYDEVYDYAPFYRKMVELALETFLNDEQFEKYGENKDFTDAVTKRYRAEMDCSASSEWAMEFAVKEVLKLYGEM